MAHRPLSFHGSLQSIHDAKELMELQVKSDNQPISGASCGSMCVL